jgi:hypothetical protein
MVEFLIGYLLTAMIDVIWGKYGSDTLRLKIRSKSEAIHKILYETLEHYHWGLALLLIDHPFIQGVSFALFTSEWLHDNPFAVDKRYFKYSCLIGSVLLILNILKMIGVL